MGAINAHQATLPLAIDMVCCVVFFRTFEINFVFFFKICENEREAAHTVIRVNRLWRQRRVDRCLWLATAQVYCCCVVTKPHFVIFVL